ncbi:MAG TPA: hypothetical protein VF629_13140 [Hymenobacter sp.]|jgi:hypothetical protein
MNEDLRSGFTDIHRVFSSGSLMPPLVTMGAAASLRVYRQWQQ